MEHTAGSKNELHNTTDQKLNPGRVFWYSWGIIIYIVILVLSFSVAMIIIKFLIASQLK